MSSQNPNHFPKAARKAVANPFLQKVLAKATTHSLNARRETVADLANWEAMREHANHIRQYSIDHLDQLLYQLETSCRANGIDVRYAIDTHEARAIIAQELRQEDAKLVVKSKSMTTEEIELNPFLEQFGIEVVETDLGEYIVQLEGKPPSHITAPALHLSREQIGKLFSDKLGIPETHDPAELTAIARDILRQKFLNADAGISGVNFACADTGRLVIVENEGNARLTTTLPKLHIAICGIEKVIAQEAYLATLLRMLARSATGQRLSTYTNFISHPSHSRDTGGPQHIILILLDNGRSRMLADPELRQSLLCIRCGACLNVCPVYRHAGGHAYGSAYMGPIGAVITPQFQGLEQAKELPFASSLCGACSEICPVKIPLPEHLLTLRKRISEQQKQHSYAEQLAFSAWREIMLSPAKYRYASKLLRIASGIGATKLLPGWTPHHAPLEVPPQSFREEWNKQRGDK